jgi:KDO2-lipid IV(A) lauroyltransferase
MIKRWGSQAIVFLMWLLHWLPLPVLAAIGEGVGALLWRLAGSRRKVVLKNLALCFPELDEAARRRLAREHFGAVARGFLEHSYLWFASEERLLRMVRIEGDIHLAERTGRPVMWLLPHFVGLDYTAPALMLKQSKPAITIYQRQSNAVFDEALLKARARFGQARLFDRQAGIRPVLRAIQKEGAGFVNLPDMDFGTKDAAFVPFFGVPAATLLAPARMAQSMHMLVQPIVVTMLRARGARGLRQPRPAAGRGGLQPLAGPASASSRPSTTGCTAASRPGPRARPRSTDSPRRREAGPRGVG